MSSVRGTLLVRRGTMFSLAVDARRMGAGDARRDTGDARRDMGDARRDTGDARREIGAGDARLDTGTGDDLLEIGTGDGTVILAGGDIALNELIDSLRPCLLGVGDPIPTLELVRPVPLQPLPRLLVRKASPDIDFQLRRNLLRRLLIRRQRQRRALRRLGLLSDPACVVDER